MKNSKIPVGSVPVYLTVCNAARKKRRIAEIGGDEFVDAVEEHMKAGVDFVTVHCAILRKGAELARKRVMPVVSRGGAFLSAWMRTKGKENPLYENFDYLLELAGEYDVALSLGDGLRPGCLADADDRAQLHELRVQGKLVKRAFEKGVSVICEGPGHVPLDKIEANIKLQKKLCHGAPYYLLGPIVTDIAPGYDHVTSAIGATVATAAGADYICVVTPSEHLALPTPEDIREGVMAARIAAHAGDIVKYGKGETDREMGRARAALNWGKQFELAIDKTKAKKIKKARDSHSKACSMCGEFCAYRYGSI